ncbi:MAG: stage III sporulation protein AF [Lachnospiraceae bacterium]|nr:stage III sporulation protein AF [Lachnospiraceae bacterium]
MLENIREIGIFMIAAQMVVHFAPGKQYEKYIKSVSGIIILLLFLKPFLQLSGVEWKEPEAVLEKLEELTDMPDFPGGEGADQEIFDRTNTDAGSAAISRVEGEMKDLLNRELEGEDYRVKSVSLRLEKDPLQEGEMVLSEVEITMEKKTGTEEERRIEIDEIVIGDATDFDEENVFSVYRGRFAALLGIEEGRVEVRLDGRG